MIRCKNYRTVFRYIFSPNYLNVVEEDGEDRMEKYLRREIDEWPQVHNKRIHHAANGHRRDMPRCNGGEDVEEDLHWIEHIKG